MRIAVHSTKPYDRRYLTAANRKHGKSEVGRRKTENGSGQLTVVHRVLEHTADTGIEAEADSLSRLVEELATAMFGLVAPVNPEAARHWVQVAVSSSGVEDLVVDVLSELLYRSEVEGVTFGAFRATISTEGHSATVQAGGVPNEEVDTTGPPIKAVTYHDLVVREHDDGWYGRVYLDV